MKSERALTFTAFSLAFILFAYFLFCVPTLDFDEALYRSVVENMKTAHNPWTLAWDGRNLFHKPPIFYWLIWSFSFFIDGAGYFVSTFAARLPSFFSTVGILLYLYFSGKRFETTENKSIGKNAALSFLCGFFPLLTATSVLFDPLQTLCLMPALVIPTFLFYQDTPLRKRDWIWWAFSLFAANATKGLNGMIVPTLAFGLHTFYSRKAFGLPRVLGLLTQFTVRVFLPAVIVTFFYYFWLNQKIGSAFTQEFIWIQHFQRGTTPMENHSGSFFYHFFVVFLGGGILIPLFLDRAQNTRLPFVKIGFPLTYALSFMVIFGLSATKLPHYSWPVWPALALYVGLISSQFPAKISEPTPASRKLFTHLPVLLLGLFAVGLAIAPVTVLTGFTRSPTFLSVMKYFSGFTSLETGFFFLAAVFCLGFEIFKERCLRSVATCAVISVIIAFCLALGLNRTVENLMVKPFYEIAEVMKKFGAQPRDCIRYSGALSPTLSLALAPELIHNRCEPTSMVHLVAPEWKVNECKELGFKIISQKEYLVFCEKE